MIKITRTADLTGTVSCFIVLRVFLFVDLPGWRLLVRRVRYRNFRRRFARTLQYYRNKVMCGSQPSVLTCRLLAVNGKRPIMWVSKRPHHTHSRFPNFFFLELIRVAGWQVQHFSSLISLQKAIMNEKSLSIIIATIERAGQSDSWFVQSPLCCRIFNEISVCMRKLSPNLCLSSILR